MADRSAWAQSAGGGQVVASELQGWLAQIQSLAGDPSVQRYGAYVIGGVLLLWLLSRIRRFLAQNREGFRAPSTLSENRRAARRAVRQGDHVMAGRYFEAAKEWEEASAAYERAGDLGSAAAMWEQLGQPVKAAQLYEQAAEWYYA